MNTITRKDFLKGSALFGAALIVGTSTGCASTSAKGADTKYDYEADVIVVGSGSAGLVACAAAHDEGASTLLIEKDVAIGGNSAFSLGYIAYWPKKTATDGWGEIDAKSYVAQWATTHKSHSQKGIRGDAAPETFPFLEKYVEISADASDFLTSLGVLFTPYVPASSGSKVPVPKGNDPMPCTVPPSGISWGMTGPEGYGDTWNKVVIDDLNTYDNCTQLTSCEADSLIQDESGRVVGVVFIDADGAFRSAKANKGIVLATGSFCGNDAMVAKYIKPQWAGYKPQGTLLNSGEGVRMAQKVGGALTDMNLGFITQAPPEGTDNPLILELYQMGFLTGNIPGIVVNCAGKRYYAESRGNSEMARNTLNQDYGLGYYVGDSSADTSFMKDYHAVRWANTLEELANAIGVDPATFVAEVERYNGFVESGTDSDFGKNMLGTTKIEKAPFYAFRVEPRPYVTLGGVKTDVDSRVLDTDNKPIPGLYAAGIVCGSYWEQDGVVYTGGLNQSVAFGNQAGRNAANQA
ncbi:MAG: FAD-binding protein [Coriobacteriia bacterium]